MTSAGNHVGFRRTAAQTAAVLALSVASSRSPVEAIDGCLVGTWTATQLSDLTGRAGGGTGFRVTFEVDGTQTVDYSRMVPISYPGGDATIYTGTAQGRISTRDHRATLERDVASGVRVQVSALHPDVPPYPLKGSLGPGGLGTTSGDNAYTCSKETLEYRSSAAVDRHPTHAVKLVRGEIAPTEEPAHGVREGGSGVGEGAREAPAKAPGETGEANSTLDPKLWQEFLDLLEEKDHSRPVSTLPPPPEPTKNAWMKEEGLPSERGCDRNTVCPTQMERLVEYFNRVTAMEEVCADAAQRWDQANEERKKAHQNWVEVAEAHPTYPLVTHASARKYIAARDAWVTAIGALNESAASYTRCRAKVLAEQSRCTGLLAKLNDCLKANNCRPESDLCP